jgi:hypothetical protein
MAKTTNSIQWAKSGQVAASSSPQKNILSTDDKSCHTFALLETEGQNPGC